MASVETGYSFLGSFLAVLAAPFALAIILILFFVGIYMYIHRRREGKVKARK